MTVLGLDCAGKTAGVAVCQDEQLVYESRLCAGFTHSETLLCLCKEALRACRLCVQKLSLLAVTAGPGSFTGLRIGLAVAKGLAFPHDIPCAGVSTLESLAFCAPPAGSCVCALDARRGEVYHAAFAMGPQGPRRLWPDGHGPAAALTEQILRLPRPLWLLGDGAGLVRLAAASRIYSCWPRTGAAPGRWVCAAPRCAYSRKARRPLPRVTCASRRQSANAPKSWPARACEHLHGKEVFV